MVVKIVSECGSDFLNNMRPSDVVRDSSTRPQAGLVGMTAFVQVGNCFHHIWKRLMYNFEFI